MASTTSRARARQQMVLARRTDRWELAGTVLWCAVLALTAVVMWRADGDIVPMLKVTVLLLGLLSFLVLCTVRIAVVRRIELPWGPTVVPVGVLAAGFILSGALSDYPALSLRGAPHWPTGMIVSVACLGVHAAVLTCVRHWRDARALALTLLGTGVAVAGYGILQMTPYDPMNWINHLNAMSSTLDNPNFAGAFVAMVLPFALYAMASRGMPRIVRLTSPVALVLLAIGVVLSRSDQAWIVGAASVTPVLLLLVKRHGERLLSVVLVVWASAAVVGVLGVVFATGPLAFLGHGETLIARTWYWDTAWRIAGDHLWSGVGTGLFFVYSVPYRHPLEALHSGWQSHVDSAHNVPLQLLAEGGMLVAVPYALFVLLTGGLLVRAFRRHSGDERLLVAAFAGCWIGYQLQSLVSIDALPLPLVHMTTAAVAAWAGGAVRHRTVTLPPRRPVTTPEGQFRRMALSLGGAAAGMTATIVLIWMVTVPMQAEVAAYTAHKVREADPALALRSAARAVELVPSSPQYWRELGAVRAVSGDPDGAMRAFEEMERRNPYRVPDLLQAAQYAERSGRAERAAGWFHRIAAAQPSAEGARLAIAAFALRHDDLATARRILAEDRPRRTNSEMRDWRMALVRELRTRQATATQPSEESVAAAVPPAKP